MIPARHMTGLILAGGRARRMQGADCAPVDKGLLEINGQSLVARARHYLEPHVARIWVSANRHLSIYARYGKVIRDNPLAGEGPLAGIASALGQIDTPWLLVVPVDVLGFPDGMVGRLAQAVLETGRAAAYATADRDHPLCMIVHRDSFDGLMAFVHGGNRTVRRWHQVNGAVPVRFDADADAFFNINTPQELEAARQASQCERS